MDRNKQLYTLVESVYTDSKARPMGAWMWHNHVQWVAGKAVELAQKYEANEEFVRAAALLHDIADAMYERGDSAADEWGEEKGYELLETAGFNKEEAKEILEVIVEPHSCKPGNLPTTLEGKVLATADAMFHLQTSFFLVLCCAHKPENTHSLTEWQEWFSEKVERDFENKIFFEDEKRAVEEDVRALRRVFGNRSLEEISQGL